MTKPSFSSTLRKVAAVTLLAAPFVATAQDYPNPNRPITIIVPYAAGGGTDNVARELAKLMSDKLGNAVVIENRGGAGGAIGSKQVAKADPDGYTLLFASSSFVTHAATEAKQSYDVNKDYAPIAMIGRGPLVVVAHKSTGAKNIKQLIEASKKNSTGLDFCSSGPGTVLHLAGELFKNKTGANLTHIAYRGSGPALTDLLAGRVHVFFATVPGVMQYVKAGNLDLLAVTSAKRSPIFPDVPTVAESGVPDYNVTTWWGLLAPAGTPAPIVAKLNAAVNEVASKEPLKTRMLNEGAEPYRGTPADFKSVLSTELKTWQDIAKATNLKL